MILNRIFPASNPGAVTVISTDYLDVNPGCTRSILNITEGSDVYDLARPSEPDHGEGKRIYPKPGFCIKSKTNEGAKVFINICHCADVQKPDENIVSPLDVDEIETVRFTLCFNLPHTEKDKAGKDCLCFDVIVNTDFLNTLLTDEEARRVVLSLCLQGIADKYDTIIRSDCCRKLKKPYHGSMDREFSITSKPYGVYSLEPDGSKA